MKNSAVILGKFIALVYLMMFSLGEASMFHQIPWNPSQNVWEQKEMAPFTEMILSWNAKRPRQGEYLIYVKVKTPTWSPWLLYACWGAEEQTSFHNTTEQAPVRVYQDAVELLAGNQATGFQVKVEANEGASLQDFYSIHVYTNGKEASSQSFPNEVDTIQLPVAGLSQMTLAHVRSKDLCSPTSTASVVRYLSQKKTVDPVSFAQNVWDKNFNIFGNWVLNVAQASHELGPNWHCWVQRLDHFMDIYSQLRQGFPVVVSVRGPLSGSALPYAQGHLITVIGYDVKQRQVICMDPAFPSDEKTLVGYPLSEFVEAWSRRGKIAYLFTKKGSL